MHYVDHGEDACINVVTARGCSWRRSSARGVENKRLVAGAARTSASLRRPCGRRTQVHPPERKCEKRFCSPRRDVMAAEARSEVERQYRRAKKNARSEILQTMVHWEVRYRAGGHRG